MRFKIFHSILLMGFLTFATEVKAQFPYTQSFKDNEAPNMEFGGSPTSALFTAGSIDPANEGFLRLTNANNEQKGYVYNNSILPTTFGMDVEFEYFMYGGSGADGLTFFLFDASTPQFTIGPSGGSMGFAHNCTGPGVSNAYLGIGFDAFGNFSGSNECRSGQSTGAGSIVVRGAGNGQSPQDYPQIASVNTNSLPVKPFMLTEGNTRATEPSMPGYRKAFITMRPQGQGFSIAIKVQHGTDTTDVLSTIIDTPPPSDFKFGFTASTGGSTNFHEIRNLKITIPENIALTSPRALDDTFPTVCSNDSVEFNILENDTTLNRGGTLLASSIDLDTIADGVQDTLIVPSVGKFFVVAPSGNVRFVPISTFESTVTVPYKVSDSYGMLSNGATFTVSGRQAPFLTPNLSISVSSGQPVDLDLSITPVISGVTYTYPNPVATGGVIGGLSRTVGDDLRIADTLINPLRSPQTVTYLVTPIANNCSGKEIPVVVTVTSGNTAPVTRTDTLFIVKNNIGNINVLENDSDFNGDVLSSTVEIISKGGASELSTSGDLQYTPNIDFSGVDTLHYLTCDAPAPSFCTKGLVIIKVRDNEPPTIVADTFYTTQQKRVTGNVKMNDSDSDGDSFGPDAVTNVATDRAGTITMSANGNFTYIPAVGFIGTDTYTYRVCDIYDACTTTVLVVIVRPNLPPVTVKDSINTLMNRSIVFSPIVNDRDPEGDPISVVSSNGLTEMGGRIISTQAGIHTYTPAVGFIGLDKYVYTVCDTMKNCSQGTIIINVIEPLNAAPIARPDSVFTTKNVTVPFNPTSNDTDPEGTALKVTIVNTTTARGGTIISDGSNILTYTPPLDYIGIDTYQYEVCDALNKCSIGDIVFVVGPTPNVRPIAIDDSLSTLAETVVSIFPLLNDTDSDGELVNNTLSAIAPKHGTVTVDPTNGSLQYIPFADYFGTDTIFYTICDNGTPSLCANAIVKVTVIPKPPIPLFIPEGFSPNGDLINQQFVIEGIEKLKVSLVIFNRWGDKVYESLDYKNDWEGISNQGVTIGKDLPDGTYFITVNLGNAEAPIVKYITINR